jgi:hypothetical protein
VSCDTDYWLIAAARLRCLKNHEGCPMGPSGLAVLTPILRVSQRGVSLSWPCDAKIMDKDTLTCGRSLGTVEVS